MNIEKKILQELVYERVRSSVNLCQLVVLEQDLDRSIERIQPRSCAPQSNNLARIYMKEAWHRLEQEWNRLRHDVNSFADPAEPGDASTEPQEPQ